MSTQIMVSNERAAQLKALAASSKTSVAGAVDLLIADAIAAGKIPDTVPGLSIERHGDIVAIEATGAFLKQVNRETAADLARQIRETLVAAVGAFVSPKLALEISRRGVGVRLVDPVTKGEKVLSPGVAKDVARHLDQAARS